MEPDKQEWGETELNQRGRPKQQVTFYSLTPQMKQEAEEALSKDQVAVTEEQYQQYINAGGKVWDKFYQYHKCNFFKDRTYLEREMPEITFFKEHYAQNKARSTYYELGCGVGNTLFPLLRQFECFDYLGCDISAKAISLIEEEVAKHEQLKERIKVCVCDLVKDEIPYQMGGDLNSLIFVLSAIAPEQHQAVMHKVAQAMKPGSFLFFRDYGKYDFGQLNLSSKGKRKLRENFYRKGDGVCVYYFEEEELKALCQKAGLSTIKISLHCKLLQNRKRALKMYRVWIQGRFYKPPLEPYFAHKLEQHTERMRKEQEEREKEEEVEEVQEAEIEESADIVKVDEVKPEEKIEEVEQVKKGSPEE